MTARIVKGDWGAQEPEFGGAKKGNRYNFYFSGQLSSFCLICSVLGVQSHPDGDYRNEMSPLGRVAVLANELAKKNGYFHDCFDG